MPWLIVLVLIPLFLLANRELFFAIQHFSRHERLPTYQQLELQIFRSGASFVLDLLRTQVGEMNP